MDYSSYIGKVSTVVTEWNATSPHVAHESDTEMTGTAFYVSGLCLGLDPDTCYGITNYHCVEQSARNRCELMLHNGDRHTCNVIHVCPELDFAVLELDFDPIGVSPLCLPDAVPAPGTRVYMIGFPLDADHCAYQHSYGAVSAPLNGEWLQCCMSCNGGNSGGPVMDYATRQVIGICTATPCASEGITLVLPIWAVCRAIKSYSSVPSIVRLPRIECEIAPMSAERACLAQMPAEGAYVVETSDQCILTELLPGDVLVSIDGRKIHRSHLTIETDAAGIVPLSNKVVPLCFPTRFTYTVRRSGVTGDITCTGVREPQKPLCVRELYPFWERIPVMTVGGIVFMPLCKNLLDAFTGYADSIELRKAWETWDKRETHSPMGAVVVAFVHMQTYASQQGVTPLSILDAIDGHEINTVDDLAAVLAKRRYVTRNPVREFIFNTGSIALNLRLLT